MPGSLGTPTITNAFDALGPAYGTKVEFDKYNRRLWSRLEGFLAGTAVTITDLVPSEFAAGIYPPFNVAAYGAALDDSTDDLAAVQAAVDAAEAAGGGIVLVPGKARVSATVTIDSDGVVLMGTGLESSHLKFTDASTETGALVEFTHATQADGCGIAEITLDGNKSNVSTSAGGLLVTNQQFFRARNVRVIASSGYGIHETTTSTGSVTTCLSNQWHGIYTGGNDGSGQHYQSAKNSQWSVLRSNGDAADGTDGDGGIVFEGGATMTNREMTEDVVTNVLISDSGRFGLVLDGVTKFPMSVVMIHSCQDSGVLLRNTNASGSNSGIINYCTWTDFDLRNNALSATFLGWAGVETAADNTAVVACQLVGWVVVGDNQANAAPGVFDVRGWSECDFIACKARVCKGDVWRVRDGENTDGSAKQAGDLQWVGCSAIACGHASATTNHTFRFDNPASGTARDFQIIGGNFQNSLTDGSTSWEVYVESNIEEVTISGAHIDAATGGGEFNIASGAENEVSVYGVTVRSDKNHTPNVGSATSIVAPVEAQNRLCTISGTNNIETIAAWPVGTKVWLQFTDAAPGDLIDGSGNLDLTGGNVSPAQNQVVGLIATSSGFAGPL